MTHPVLTQDWILLNVMIPHQSEFPGCSSFTSQATLIQKLSFAQYNSFPSFLVW